MNEITQGQYWWLTVLVAAASFALGQLVPRFWMTRKERKDYEQTNYVNTTGLLEKHDAVRTAYMDSMKAYCDADDVTVEMFTDIAICGTRYFDQVSLLCDAVLSEKVDVQVRDNTIFPKIRGVADRTLPLHYKTLQNIAKKKGFPYAGKLRRSDYQGIFAVAEKHDLMALRDD